MAKVTADADEARLTKKVREKQAATDNPEGDGSLRALRKHLKRLQRKRRALMLRKQRASGKKKPTEGQAAPVEKPAE
ncbi:MAG TPA: hypothetical protein VGQ60_02970 [Nitrospiraceae bacterium]|jgi:hypothetical protein|nr:hypothetical protein [Nitrospiraceae bacterium]